MSALCMCLLLLDNSNLTFSRTHSAVFIYSTPKGLVSETILLTSPTKILSAQPQSQTVYLRLSPNYQLVYYLSWLRCLRSGTLQQPFSSLSTIFGSVELSHAVRFSSPSEPWMCNSSGTLRSLQFITLAALSFLRSAFLVIWDTHRQGWLLMSSRFAKTSRIQSIPPPSPNLSYMQFSACLDSLFRSASDLMSAKLRYLPYGGFFKFS